MYKYKKIVILLRAEQQFTLLVSLSVYFGRWVLLLLSEIIIFHLYIPYFDIYIQKRLKQGVNHEILKEKKNYITTFLAEWNYNLHFLILL